MTTLFDMMPPQSPNCEGCGHSRAIHTSGRCGYPACRCGEVPVAPYRGGLPPSVAGSDTSAAAARSQLPTIGTKQRVVLDLVRGSAAGLTDDDLERLTGWRHQTVSARRRELVLSGLLRDSGMRRVTSSGRNAAVWASA